MTSIDHVRRGAARALAVALLLCAMAAVAGPGHAGAHARVAGTSPADGSEVGALPHRVTITFAAKPATAEGDPVRVYDPAGVRIDGGVRVERGGEVLSVGVPAGAGATGRYEVAYHVVSADSHLVAGRFGFTVTGTGVEDGTGAADGSGSGGSAGVTVAGVGAGAVARDGPGGDPVIGTAASIGRAGVGRPSPAPVPAAPGPDRRLRPAGAADMRPELVTGGAAAVVAAVRLRRSRAERRLRPVRAVPVGQAAPGGPRRPGPGARRGGPRP